MNCTIFWITLLLNFLTVLDARGGGRGGGFGGRGFSRARGASARGRGFTGGKYGAARTSGWMSSHSKYVGGYRGTKGTWMGHRGPSLYPVYLFGWGNGYRTYHVTPASPSVPSDQSDFANDKEQSGCVSCVFESLKDYFFPPHFITFSHNTSSFAPINVTCSGGVSVDQSIVFEQDFRVPIRQENPIDCLFSVVSEMKETKECTCSLQHSGNDIFLDIQQNAVFSAPQFAQAGTIVCDWDDGDKKLLSKEAQKVFDNHL